MKWKAFQRSCLSKLHLNVLLLLWPQSDKEQVSAVMTSVNQSEWVWLAVSGYIFYISVHLFLTIQMVRNKLMDFKAWTWNWEGTRWCIKIMYCGLILQRFFFLDVCIYFPIVDCKAAWGFRRSCIFIFSSMKKIILMSFFDVLALFYTTSSWRVPCIT